MAPQAQEALGGHLALVSILGQRPCEEESLMLEKMEIKD